MTYPLRALSWLLRTIEGFLYWHIGHLLSDFFGGAARRLERLYEED